VDQGGSFVVLAPGTDHERWVEVRDRLVIGRECVGIDDAHRLIIDDPEVSRQHLVIELDPERERAVVIDASTNGTYLDGLRLSRSHPTTLKDGSRLAVGSAELQFRSARFRHSGLLDVRPTQRRTRPSRLVMVVGDIVEFTRASQDAPPEVLAADLDLLFGELHRTLTTQSGSLANYVGDAFFAVWDIERQVGAIERALAFVSGAVDVVANVAPKLTLRDAAGHPIRMGWAVGAGSASIQPMPGGVTAVLGDAANLVFRLSGAAGRAGLDTVLVTADIAASTPAAGPPFPLDVKGRSAPVSVAALRV
jgi:class 3 adenylate cyclase